MSREEDIAFCALNFRMDHVDSPIIKYLHAHPEEGRNYLVYVRACANQNILDRLKVVINDAVAKGEKIVWEDAWNEERFGKRPSPLLLGRFKELTSQETRTENSHRRRKELGLTIVRSGQTSS